MDYAAFERFTHYGATARSIPLNACTAAFIFERPVIFLYSRR
jgi:hypothetical protein